MRGPLARRHLAATLMAVCATALAVPAASAPSCPQAGVMVRQRDLWTRVAAPTFPTGGPTILDFDVNRYDANSLVVTNGTGIVASYDGGCSWKKATLPDPAPVPLPAVPIGEGGVINASVDMVRAAGATGVWATGMTSIVSSGVPVTQPRVLHSDDGGATFEQRVNGLPPIGRPVWIVPFDLLNAELLYHAKSPTDEYAIYRTSDGGKTWSSLWTGLPPLERFVATPRGVWAWDAAKLYHALTWPAVTPFVPINGIPGAVSAVDVTTDPTYGFETTSVFLRAGSERYVSKDGVTFTAKPAPEGVQSVAHSADNTVVISSATVNVLVEPGPLRPKGDLDYSPAEVNVHDVRVSSSRNPYSFPIYAQDAAALFRREVDFVPPPPIQVELTPPVVTKPKPAVEPWNPVVTLKPDERKVVPFTINMPPAPTPLDVFFMTDSTGSMSSTIGSVQESVQQIVDDLSATGIDLHFGVADFRDWPEQPGDSTTYPYKRHRIAGPIDADLADALEGLRTGGGTTDGDDSALEAIYQAVTGAGRVDPLKARGQMLEPGLDAKFRKDAMKVVLVVSDDEMRPGFPNPTRPDYPGPTIDAVATALKDNDVRLVGIRVGTSAALRKDMEKLAAASGTLAPDGGVDCDGDEAPDLKTGEALVCDFEPGADDSIAPAFISLLAGIRDYAPVSIGIGDPTGVARAVAKTDYGMLDVKARHTFKVPVEFRCDRATYDTESHVDVGAYVRGQRIVGTTATVRCGVPAKPAPKPEPPEPLPPDLPHPVVKTVVAVAVAPVAPAQPVTNPNTNPNPNPNPNPGAATESEQQNELALAENNFPDESQGEELAMSARSVPVPSTPVVAWLAAAAMTGAAAFGVHLQRRTRPAIAFDPREYR